MTDNMKLAARLALGLFYESGGHTLGIEAGAQIRIPASHRINVYLGAGLAYSSPMTFTLQPYDRLTEREREASVKADSAEGPSFDSFWRVIVEKRLSPGWSLGFFVDMGGRIRAFSIHKSRSDESGEHLIYDDTNVQLLLRQGLTTAVNLAENVGLRFVAGLSAATLAHGSRIQPSGLEFIGGLNLFYEWK